MQLLRPFIICLTAFYLANSPAFAAEKTNTATMSLSGTGQVTAAPDMAMITSGVRSQAKTAREALDQNNAAMTAILKTLSDTGIEKKHIQTSNFSIQPRFTYPQSSKGVPQPPVLMGYDVYNQLTVKIVDLNKVGILLDAMITDGANQVSDIQFGIQDKAPLLAEARRKATRAAMAKAKLYAEETGVKLGRILSISEAGGYTPPRPVFARAEAASFKAADAVPVAGGEQTMRITVNIIWELQN